MSRPYRSAGETITGKVRKHNEDAILVRDDLGLWVVADGMGGYTAGEYASQLIVERLGALTRSGGVFDFVEAIEDTLVQVNQELIDAATERGVDIIGSTVVLLVHAQDYMLCGWVGDSRAYCFEAGNLEQITTDHVVGVSRGNATQVSGKDAPRPEPGAGALTRAVGAEDRLFVDWAVAGCRRGMQFVLCSDGINKEMSDAEIEAECRRRGSAQELTASLLGMAQNRAARDNLSAVTVWVQD